MDRMLASKWLLFVAIVLAAVYVWANFWWFSNAVRVLVSDWWR